MSETIHFDSAGVLVTTRRVRIGATMYPLRTISSVRAKYSPDVRWVAAMGIGLAFLGVIALVNNNAGVGAVCILMGGGLAMAALQAPRAELVLRAAGGESHRLRAPASEVRDIEVAINRAIAES